MEEEEVGEDLALTVATEVEYKEIAETPLKDIREGSESNKAPEAKAHFNDFLEIRTFYLGIVKSSTGLWVKNGLV